MKKTYQDQIECLEAIGAYLVSSVPGAWERIDVDVKILKGGVVMTQTRFQPTGSTVLEDFGIEDLQQDLEFGDCFLQLRDLVRTEQTAPFTGCHYELQRSGRYHVDYEY